MDNYNDSEDIIQLLKNLDTVSVNHFEFIKRSFHDCLNNTKDVEYLKALVIYYLKTDSERALEILVAVREPHDRNLFDILVENMKQTAHRQQSLILISHIVHKSPAWLPKIINNPKVLQSFFTILKTDQEVLPLVTSLLVLVELISTLPSIMALCLSDIFECFSRLCSSLTKKNTLNTSDFDILHLHVCVYRLFNRLYALYPCNFLAYLRSTYGSNKDPNKENLTVFNEILQPMLQRVRLHPLLVTAAKETEFSTNRWLNMEPHDIIAECAKLVLDPIEGIQEECDFCSDIHMFCSESSTLSSHIKSRTSNNEKSITPLSFAKLNSNSIIGKTNNELMSGTEIVSISSMIKDTVNNSQELEMNASPKQSIETNDAIRISSPNSKSIPPLDVAQEAIPVLANAENNSIDETLTNSMPEVISQRSISSNDSQQQNIFSQNSQIDCFNQSVIDEEDIEVSEINANASHLSSITISEPNRIEGPMTPFISTTCYLTDGKHEYVCNDNELRVDETNDLVGKLFMSSFRHANSRLRYQSQCVPSPDFIGESILKSLALTKSKSCPVLYFNSQSEQQIVVKVSKTPSNVKQTLDSSSIDIKNKRIDSLKYDNTLTVNKPDYSRLSSITSSICCNCNCLGYVNSDGTANQRVCNCSCTGNMSLCQYLFQHYKAQSRNSIHRSASRASATERQQNCLSPLEILDRHLTLGSEICLKELNNPLTSKKETDWTHFGGEPPNDEINVLKSHIALMHSQLLFERQQRESHATRNRRLLKKAKEYIALQEKFSAQREQLLLQENEIELLKKEINNCRESNQKIEKESNRERKHLKEEILNYVKKCKELEDNKRELKDNIELYKDQTKVLHINYQKLEAENLELKEDMKRYDKQNGSIDNIKRDNRNLKTQLLMLSELYQGLKDRFTLINKNASFDEISVIESESRNKELKESRAKLETTIVQMDAYKTKCSEIENLMSKKDHIISELKQTIENIKSQHKTQLQAEHQRVQALKKVSQQLEQHILSLYGQLGMREHEQRLRQLDSAEEQPLAQSLVDSSVENNSNSREEQNSVNSFGNHNFSNGNHNEN